MHNSVLEWGKAQIAKYGLADKSVLEVGSLNVNGSLRPYFTGEYLGIDMRAGKGVDVVAQGQDLIFMSLRVDVVVCTEMLEHDATFWVTLDGIERVLNPGGYLLLTTRGIGFPKHSHPSDYYRFTTEAVRGLLTRIGLEVLSCDDDPEQSGVLAVGHKP